MMSLPLFLSDVGGSEILLIVLVVLIFFGPKSIPGIAKTMGKAMYQIKQASQDVQNEIKKSTGDLKTDFDLQKIVRETTDIVEKPILEETRKMDQIIDAPSQHSRAYQSNFSRSLNEQKAQNEPIKLDQMESSDSSSLEDNAV